MSFTSREEYGIRAVMHLAVHKASWPVQAREIASAEGIPEQFLEQVLAALRRAGVVRSIRGATGGYELVRPAGSITAGDVVRALSGAVSEESDRCGQIERSAIVSLSERIRDAVSEILDGTTIQDMVDERMRKEQVSSFAMNI